MEYRLVPFSEIHAKCVVSWIQTAEDLLLFAGSAYQFPLTEEQLMASANDDKQRVFSLVNEKNELEGHCQLFLLVNAIKIGRVLIPANQRGKSIGERMIRLLLEYIQMYFPNQLITLNVFSFNKPAIQLYEKLGFVRQPIGAKTVEINGNTWTSFQMDYAAY